ncbi:MAG: hypothetical protein ACSHYA_19035 [Opitutaceae bacterium]
MEFPIHIYRSKWILALFISVNGIFSILGILSAFGFEIIEGGRILLFAVPIFAYFLVLVARNRPTVSIYEDRIGFYGDEVVLEMGDLLSIRTNDEGPNSESPQDLIFNLRKGVSKKMSGFRPFHRVDEDELYLQFTGRQLTCKQAVVLIDEVLETWKQNQTSGVND